MAQNGIINTTNHTSQFLGNHTIKILRGYRIVLPASYRPSLQNGFILTKGLERNLYVFDNRRWQKLLEPLSKGNFLNSKLRTLLRYLAAHAFVITPDSQGRFIIPKALREFPSKPTQPGDMLTIAGLINWLEIWHIDDWRKTITNLKANVSDIADLLANIPPSENDT